MCRQFNTFATVWVLWLILFIFYASYNSVSTLFIQDINLNYLSSLPSVGLTCWEARVDQTSLSPKLHWKGWDEQTNPWPHWRQWNFAIDFVGFKFLPMNSSTLLQEQWTAGLVNRQCWKRQSTIQSGVCSSPSPVKLCWAVSWVGLCNKLLLSMKVKKEIICFCPELFIRENNPTQSKELLRLNHCIAASLMESDSHTIFTSLWCCHKFVSRQKCKMPVLLVVLFPALNI